MKLGISGAGLCQVKSIEEVILTLKKYGTSFIEIWPGNIPINENQANTNLDEYAGRNVVKAKEILKKHDMKVSCVSMPGAFNNDISSSPERYREALRYAVEVAKELEAPFVNHYCYNLCLEETPNIKNILKYMEPAIELAVKEGIVMCLENEAHDATRTPEGMLSIIEAVDSKYFKTNFDATNYYHASIEGFPRAYDVLKEHIAYVHIKNGCIYNPAYGHSEKSKGGIMTGANSPNLIYYPLAQDGAVNIDGLLQRLKRDGYEGFCVLEPHTTSENCEYYYKEETSYLRSRGYFI